MRSKIAIVAVAAVTAAVIAVPATATTGKGSLFLDGATVGTVVPPDHIADGTGTDPLYMVTNGAEGQLSVAGVGPGDGAYHGGRWQVWLVTFDAGVTPYLLTSDEAVFAAEAAGDVTVTRAPEADNRCPVLQS